MAVELILNLFKARFFWLSNPRLVLLQSCWRCLSFPVSCRHWGGLKAALPDPNPQHLPGNPSMCEGSLPGSEGTKPSWLQHKACGSSSSLFLTFPEGHHLSPFRFCLSNSFFGTFPSTSSSTGCFLFSPHPRGCHSVPGSELGSPFPLTTADFPLTKLFLWISVTEKPVALTSSGG